MIIKLLHNVHGRVFFREPHSGQLRIHAKSGKSRLQSTHVHRHYLYVHDLKWQRYHYLESEDMFILRALTPEDRYTNREEKLAMSRENDAAQILGEGIRKPHGPGGTFSLKQFSAQPVTYFVAHPMDSQMMQRKYTQA